MAFITEDFVGDRSIQLGNEEIIRAPSFGQVWLKIRISVRCAIVPTFASIASGVNGLRAGVCVGTNAALSNNTVDAIWQHCWNSASPSYGGTAPTGYIWQNSTQPPWYQRVAGVTTVGSGGSGQSTIISTGSATIRHMWMLDITKGTVGDSTLVLKAWYVSTAGTDITRAIYLTNIENEASPPSMTAGNTTTNPLPGGRFNKDWDNVFVGWGLCVPALTVYDFSVTRFS